jgi:hydroxymethylpyrimidine pyrophosphatase-like HAD family hydrolase
MPFDYEGVHMDIKMIVTDLDGTLLRSDKTISGYTASIFKRCRDKGIKIVFATARPVRAVKKWLNINDSGVKTSINLSKYGIIQIRGQECEVCSHGF